MSEEEKKDCKPGYNSCDITDDSINEKNTQPDDPNAEKECKQGFNSCSIAGEEEAKAEDQACDAEEKKDGEKDCKPGFNSCDI